MKNLYFDTETTGLPYRQDPARRCGQTHNSNGYPRLVQLAWILTDENDNTLSRQSHIVRPEGFSIPGESASIHGITTAEALEKGKPLLDVLHIFSKDLLQADNIIGHNIGFDESVLFGELRRKGQRKAMAWLEHLPETDTMRSTVEFCAIPFPENWQGSYDSEYKYPKLCELHYKLFGSTFENAHDALADIEATRRCYIELCRRGIL